MSIADGIGVIGAMTIVAAYLMLQVGRLDARSLSYSIANGLGAAAIIFSLIFDFNLGAFVMEAFWLAISLYGIYRAFGLRKPSKERISTSRDDSDSFKRS